MIRFIHIADVHIGMSFKHASFSRELAIERRREMKETFYRVLSYCEEKKIDLLLIAGDLLEDGYITISEIKDINHRLSMLEHTKVLICAGNHDPIIDNVSCYNTIKWSDNVHIFKTEMEVFSIEKLQLQIHSFSWSQKHFPALDINDLPKKNDYMNSILMLHGDAYSDSNYLSLKADELESFKYDYVALGHIHKHGYIKPWMAYPGSLEGLDFSEDGCHGMIEGRIDQDGLTTHFIPFAKRQFKTIELKVKSSMSFESIKDFLVKTLESIDSENMYRIIMTGEVDREVIVDIEELERIAQDMVYYAQIKNQLELDIDIDALKRDYEGSMIAAYIDYIENLDASISKDTKKEALNEGLRLLLKEQV